MADKLSLPHRMWRMLPADARRAGLQMVASRMAQKPDAVPPATSHGVVVGGEFGQATGLGEAARILQAACGHLGMARGICQMSVGGRGDAAPLDPKAALLLTVNAPSLPLMLARAPAGLLRKRRVIGAWAWELPVMPESWRAGGSYLHEIWACSRFTGDALETMFPGRVRVVPYPVAMLNRPSLPMSRDDFALPEEAVITTLVFSLGSSFTRKNPLGGIAAFKKAFGDRADQLLVVKLSGQEAFPAEAAAIRAMAGDARNIMVFEGSWAPARVDALIGLSDIILSLHRAEGFGLVPAQAMLKGVPVVATGWSGNMQFMDEASAALVGYELIEVKDPSGVYGHIPGAKWAAPDIAHAAEQLRRLGDDAAARLALGAAGEKQARAVLMGAELRAALAANGITA